MPETKEYRLTNYYNRFELRFAEEQLKKYGAKEGKDYVWRQEGKLWAIYILKK